VYAHHVVSALAWPIWTLIVGRVRKSRVFVLLVPLYGNTFLPWHCFMVGQWATLHNSATVLHPNSTSTNPGRKASL